MGDACDQVAQIHDDGCRGHEFLLEVWFLTFYTILVGIFVATFRHKFQLFL